MSPKVPELFLIWQTVGTLLWLLHNNGVCSCKNNLTEIISSKKNQNQKCDKRCSRNALYAALNYPALMVTCCHCYSGLQCHHTQNINFKSTLNKVHNHPLNKNEKLNTWIFTVLFPNNSSTWMDFSLFRYKQPAAAKQSTQRDICLSNFFFPRCSL